MNNKILLIVLSVVMVISLALVSFYLYTRYETAKNNKTNVSQNTPNPDAGSQNNPSLTEEVTRFIPHVVLPAAKVGTAYKATVESGANNVIAQVNAKVESGLPSGLQLTSCETKYLNTDPPLNQAKSSTGTCTIEGIPEESGNFIVRVNFSYSVPGGTNDFFTDYPLVVNP